MQHPILTVDKEANQKIHVRQSRYLSSGDVKPEEDETVWWVPLRLITAGSSEATKDILRKKESDFDLPKGSEEFIKLNAGQTGVYRVLYPVDVVKQMGAAIRKGGVLGTSDRVGVLTDTGALAVSGYGKTSLVLTLLQSFQEEQEYM